MKIFIDSANVQEVKEALSLGLVTGVTTNPALVAKEPPYEGGYYNYLRYLLRETKAADYPFSVQPPVNLISESPIEHLAIMKGALQTRGLTVKIPVAPNTIHLIRKIAATGTPVNATCIYTAEQAVAAATAGARYVSFFWCRIIDDKKDPAKQVRAVRTLLNESKNACEIIAGSIRTRLDAMNAFNAGAHIVTASLKVIKEMTHDPLSDESAMKFELARAEWEAKPVIEAVVN